MASITSTTTPVPNSRSLDFLLSIRQNVSVEEQDEIDAIHLWSLLDEEIDNKVSYFLDKGKKWIVIDWVTAHMDDLRLGFTKQQGNFEPNEIRSTLLQQQYGVSPNNSSSSTFTSFFVDFADEDSAIDYDQTIVKQYITKKYNINDISKKQLYNALQEIIKYHKEDSSARNQNVFENISYCFKNPRLVTLSKEQTEQGNYQLRFMFDNKIVREMLITESKFKDGSRWSFTIRTSLGLNFNTKVLNLHFVIMDRKHYTENKNIKDALDRCYQGKILNTNLIKLVSGDLVESKRLKKMIKELIGNNKKVDRNSYRTMQAKKELRDKILERLKSNSKKRKKSSKKTKNFQIKHSIPIIVSMK